MKIYAKNDNYRRCNRLHDFGIPWHNNFLVHISFMIKMSRGNDLWRFFLSTLTTRIARFAHFVHAMRLFFFFLWRKLSQQRFCDGRKNGGYILSEALLQRQTNDHTYFFFLFNPYIAVALFRLNSATIFAYRRSVYSSL